MDGFELNKIFGALVGAFAVFLAIEIVSDAVFGGGGHHHEEKLAFAVAIEGAETAGAAEEVKDPPIETLLASADVAKGERVFKKCAACHVAEKGGANKVGPQLYGIVGRQIAGLGDFKYSGALSGKEGVWDWTALDGFLKAPRKWAEGTSMGFKGLKKPQERADIIAWLNQQSDAPAPIPAAE